jgi:hypothetical protein
MAARCLIELGTPADAEPCSPAHWPDTTTPTPASRLTTWLAEGYAKTGDLDAARSTLDCATSTEAHSGSVRLQRRVRTSRQPDRPPQRTAAQGPADARAVAGAREPAH